MKTSRQPDKSIKPRAVDTLPPPILLEGYYVTRFSFEANEAWTGKNNVDFDLGMSTHLMQNPEDEKKYAINMELALKPAADLPYSVDMEIFGVFVVNKHIPEEHWEYVVQVSGTSILYSAAREFILATTGRGPNPPLMLPTTTFQPLPAEGKKKKK